MTHAEAGQPSPEQRVLAPQTLVPSEPHDASPWHQAAHRIADVFGWQPLMLAAGVGGYVLWQTKIKRLLKK